MHAWLSLLRTPILEAFYIKFSSNPKAIAFTLFSFAFILCPPRDRLALLDLELLIFDPGRCSFCVQELDQDNPTSTKALLDIEQPLVDIDYNLCLLLRFSTCLISCRRTLVEI